MADTNATDMTALAIVHSALATWPAPRVVGSAVIVPTHCVRQDGSVVRVAVVGSMGGFVVHDDGGALSELADAGAHVPDAIFALRRHFSGNGLSIADTGEILSPTVPVSDLAPTIALIANASKEAGEFLLGRWKPTTVRNFRAALRKLLEAEFPTVEHDYVLHGASNKQHRFDFAIPRSGGNVVVLDAVTHDPNAIRSAIVRGIDVTRADAPNVQLRIVYDDDAEWSADDLSLLQLGGTLVAASNAREVLHRLAA